MTPQNCATRRVVKVGGSLLDFDALPAALTGWLKRQQPADTTIVVGGGTWVEAVREADCRFELGDATAHHLAIEAMRVTARLTAALLPAARLVNALDELPRAWQAARAAIFDVSGWLVARGIAGEEPQLPSNWSATSDSIAALLAWRLDAAELVLMKSTLPEAGIGSLRAAAEAGYVDAAFPRLAAARAPVRCVALRAAGWPECWLT